MTPKKEQSLLCCAHRHYGQELLHGKTKTQKKYMTYTPCSRIVMKILTPYFKKSNVVNGENPDRTISTEFHLILTV